MFAAKVRGDIIKLPPDESDTAAASKASSPSRSAFFVFAFLLVWVCYVSMGISANICPPLQDISALGSPQAKNGILSLAQPKSLAPFLLVARLAVLIQSMSVYPVLLFIVRSQLFTAFVYRRPYPGVLPTAILAAAQAAITTSFVILGVDIAIDNDIDNERSYLELN